MDKVAYKFVLGTGKVIFLREPKIADQEIVGRLAGKDGERNSFAMALSYRKEMLKQLLIQVDNEKISGPINLDNMFSFREYQQALQAVTKVTGEDEQLGNLASEIVTFGEL